MLESEASKIVTVLLNAFPVQQNKVISLEKMVGVWYLAVLSGVDYATANAVAIQLIRKCKFLPAVADFCEELNNLRKIVSGVPTAEEAWEEVRKNLNYYQRQTYSHPLIRAAVDVMGYRNLCCSENPSIDRAQFIKIYNNTETIERGRIEAKQTFEKLGINAMALISDVSGKCGVPKCL